VTSSRETAAVDQLVAAKDAYREDPSEANRKARDKAVAKVQKIRAEEREGRTGLSVGGDAEQTGV
jgi:hypothetical protein